ncbi:MAG: DUF1989 domain-containing protein [Boseongicola sp.]|nr:MAG: DUF1989 domain-containing protein [Boseongicola sp.]
MGAGFSLQDFSNVGMRSHFRAFPGFPSNSDQERYALSPRGAVGIPLKSGDLVSISGNVGRAFVVVFGESGEEAATALNLAIDCRLDGLAFDRAEVEGWASARGVCALDRGASSIGENSVTNLKARENCTAWFILTANSGDVVSGHEDAKVEISVARVGGTVRIPDPLGAVSEEFTVTRGTAFAYELAKGEAVQIIDVEGQQCSDFMAFRLRGLDRGAEIMIDSTSTRSLVRGSYPRPGLLDKFYDRDMAPMLQVLQDTCGRHDTFGLACTSRGYEERGFPGHVNCSDNISVATARFGVAERRAWPAINFFWNTWIDPHSHHIQTEESYSRPGDYVAMRAMDDLVCVTTACPDDIDPINGWNPTDIHVRVYNPDIPIRRAVAYRSKEDSRMSVSRESAFHARIANLTNDLVPARDLWMPNSFPAVGTIGEYWACREAVTVQDMSSLRKYDIAGPDAEALLQKLLTRDISRLAVWRGTYALMCDETGAVVDDGTLFRLGPQLFRWCCGSEESARRIEAIVASEGMQARLIDMSHALANIAVQGPKARDVLTNFVFTQPHVPSIDQMKWFGVTVARLQDREGAPFMLSRTGYTGELGYEIFCTQSDALQIWDAVMEAGKAHGISPMGNAALDIVRIEAGLAASGAEFDAGNDAWEAGLGFAVDMRKPDFVGRDALERNARDPRRILSGLIFEGNDVPLHGAGVYLDERQVGVVTSATRSPALGSGIAMARLAVEFAEIGTTLSVGMMDGHMKRLPATVADIPFVDPKRERARA